MQLKDLYDWAGILGGLVGLFLGLQPPEASSLPMNTLGSEERREAIATQNPAVSDTNKSVIPLNLSSPATHPETHSETHSETLAEADAALNPVAQYFIEIALGREWGDTTPSLRRWHRDELRVTIRGNPTDQDWQVLRQVTQELSQLTGMGLTLTNLETDLETDQVPSEIEIYFRPEAEFSRLLPTYQPGNKGFFWVWWNEAGLERAKILIASEGITPIERAHLIREELTQSLGLMQDSWAQPDSIFYQGWTTTLEYTAIDQALIQLLYQPQMRTGMTQAEVIQVLMQLSAYTT